MEKNTKTKEFDFKFSELNENNQNYILAIQQALMFAQTTESSLEEEKKDSVKKVSSKGLSR